MQRRMSLAGMTGILDGIQAAAVPVRRRRLRLLPYALLAKDQVLREASAPPQARILEPARYLRLVDLE
jgi:hypothetical protein